MTDLPGDEFANEPIGGATIGCAICVNTGPRQPATRTVRNLRVCDEHAELVATFHGKDLAALFRAVRRDR